MDKQLVSLTCNSATVCEGYGYAFGVAMQEDRKVRSTEEHAQLADGRFDITTDFVPTAVTSSYTPR